MMMKRFFMKRFRTFSIIMILPIVIISLISLFILVQNKKAELLHQEMNTVNRINDTLDNTISNAIFQQNSMMSNAQYALSLKKVMAYSDMDLKDSIFLAALKTLLSKYEASNTYIHSIYLYLDGTNRIMTSEAEEIASLQKFHDLDFLQGYQSMNPEDRMYIISRPVKRYSFEKAVDVATIYQRMSYMNGVIGVNIKKKELSEMLSGLSSSDGQTFCVVNTDGEIILAGDEKISDDREFTGRIFPQMAQELKETGRYSHNKRWISLKKESYLICVKKSMTLPVYQVILIPRSYLIQSVWDSFKGVMLMIGILIGLVMFLAWVTTKRSFGYIQDCIEIFSAAENGDMLEKPPMDVKDEYGLLLNNIIYMYLHNNQMKASLREKQHQSEMSEMVALQLQINPHFISNTLQTMDMEVLKVLGSQSAMHNLMQELNSIIHYIFRNPMELVTIEEELKYLKAYCEIQYVRFPNQSIVYYEIDDQVLSDQVFRLILQPMLENSFCHGRKGNGDMLYIKVKIMKQHGNLTFTVVDNGIGMEQDEMKKVCERINNPESRNIGLTNLNRRLILNYGKESGLHIMSKYGMGTVIHFQIACSNLNRDLLFHRSKH